MSTVLVICEKPSAAKRIAHALDDNGAPTEVKRRGASYFQCRNGEDTLLVAYAKGHLYELRQVEKGWTYPRLDVEWAPKYEVVKKATDTKAIIALIRSLAKRADQFIVATDYDIEGSLIGYLVVKYACGADPSIAQRMIFSALTDKELRAAYASRAQELDFQLVEAGHLRHEIDWLYGINLTRALTLAIKRTAGWFKIVSTGRVQGPTLAMVAARDQEVNQFVPHPFWSIDAQGEWDGRELHLKYSKDRIDTVHAAEEVVRATHGQVGHVASVRTRVMTQKPPVPFNLGGLQTEAYRHFGFKPSRTLALAQRLYLDALISYPRTNNQQIPESIDVRSVLHGLSSMRAYKGHASALLSRRVLQPTQGKKTDPAHPAIHPTGETPSRRLTPSEKRLFDLIVKRFFALFGPPAKKKSVRADIVCNDHTFYLRGREVLEPGWIEFYRPYVTSEEVEVPGLTEGDEVRLTRVRAVEKYTSPPLRFNPASLLKSLEKENLGTKATRAGIVDSLRSRGYTLNDRFELSTLGYAVFETLQRHVPRLLSVEFTRSLEEEMNMIQEGKRTREEVLVRAKEDLREILSKFKSLESEIGNELVEGLQRFWREKEEVGPCPKCDDGTLMIVRSPKSGKRFIGCSNYRTGKCDKTFPLPQKGNIVVLDKECPYCGHRMLRITSKRRTWETCINWAECPGRAEELRALEERRATRGAKG